MEFCKSCAVKLAELGISVRSSDVILPGTPILDAPPAQEDETGTGEIAFIVGGSCCIFLLVLLPLFLRWRRNKKYRPGEGPRSRYDKDLTVSAQRAFEEAFHVRMYGRKKPEYVEPEPLPTAAELAPKSVQPTRGDGKPFSTKMEYRGKFGARMKVHGRMEPTMLRQIEPDALSNDSLDEFRGRIEGGVLSQREEKEISRFPKSGDEDMRSHLGYTGAVYVPGMHGPMSSSQHRRHSTGSTEEWKAMGDGFRKV